MWYRLTAFGVFSLLVAVAAHLFFGSIIFAAEQERDFTIVLRDVYHDETHELSGMVMTPSECHDVIARPKDFDIRTTFIVMETLERSQVASCEKIPTPHAINLIVFGPEELSFKALLDGETAPLTVVRAEK